MTGNEVRSIFLNYFAKHGHKIVKSSPLLPANDPTLLFTNAGMNQFKDIILGNHPAKYKRVADSQKCLRVSGKHNDLENVGYTARHHTFFEMLGNWSFGDYFKRDSLKWGWELLTQVYKLPADKLWATVYIDDDEAYDIWTQEIGLPPERVVRIGDNKGGKYMSDNFWMMADTGPCGPCSEIFYDHGPSIAGGPPGSPDADGDRYIEIWNHVFMQFDMQPDGSVKPLPAPCVDTGMGLERLAAILQHVHSNYEIDIFDQLIKAAARETGVADLDNKSLRVIADHIRATAFLVSDGVIPSNEGRGYVQRRIVRRAIRHGYKLGKKTPFFHKLVKDLVLEMGSAYPELTANAKRVEETLLAEELATEKMRYTLELKAKRVEETALEGEAEKTRREKAAQASATEQVIAAKAQEEAMRHVLPFKQKQIEQRTLEAEADKVSRIRSAEGLAQARRIEAAGEADSRRNLADAEAYRQDNLGKIASAQMARDGALISKHPLLIQKTMADKLSDKIQVIIAPPPADGGFIGTALLGGGRQKTQASAAPATAKADAQVEEGTEQ